MEIIRNLINRLRRTGVLFLVGLLLIVYIAFGFLYWQQGVQQQEFEEQIAKLSAVVARPLASGEELQAEYQRVNLALAPKDDNADYIAILVDIAEKSGIDVSPGAGRFRVPPAKVSNTVMAGSNYRLVSFSNIHVQGDRDSVMAFLSDLDSGQTLETMLLKKVIINEVETTFTDEEGARRREFRQVEAAVKKMMDDIGLLTIPYPINSVGGVATNLMGDDPATGDIIEGFPDITTTASDRGYIGSGTPRDGYVLYNHDKISAVDATQYETVKYIEVRATQYYYTAEADGTVRQFDGANLATATQFLGSEGTAIEVVAKVDVSIYTK